MRGFGSGLGLRKKEYMSGLKIDHLVHYARAMRGLYRYIVGYFIGICLGLGFQVKRDIRMENQNKAFGNLSQHHLLPLTDHPQPWHVHAPPVVGGPVEPLLCMSAPSVLHQQPKRVRP